MTIIATAARRDGIDRVAVRRSAGQNALRDQARAEEEGNLERQR